MLYIVIDQGKTFSLPSSKSELKQRGRRSHRSLSALIALGLFAISLIARVPFCFPSALTYDAADYARAMRSGFHGQFLDSDSISFTDFYHRYRNDKEFRKHPWGPIYNSGDGSALRHFHVPLAFYLPAIAESLHLSFADQNLIIACESSLTIAATFLLLATLTRNRIVAGLVALFLAWSPVLILAGTNISPHPLFTLWALLTVWAYVQWDKTKSPASAAALLAGCALSVATLELSPLLGATLFVLFVLRWWSRRKDRSSARDHLLLLGTAVVIVAGFLAVLWPGGILRGGYLMSYGTFFFQGIFRSSLYFKDRSVVSGVLKLGHGPILGIAFLVLLVVSIGGLLKYRKYVEITAFSLFALLLFGQGMANGFRNPTYASHAVVMIAVSAALVLGRLLKSPSTAQVRLAQGMFGILAILTVAEGVGLLAASPKEAGHDADRVAGAISTIRRFYSAGTNFVVTQDPQAFILNGPEYRFMGSAAVNSAEPQPWTRVGHYYLLVDREEAGQPQGVALCNPGDLAQFGFSVSCAELPGNVTPE